jgi:hypothetical protein
MSEKQLKGLMISLEENIEDTDYWIDHAPTAEDWHWHVGYRSALKEMLAILKTIEE